MQQALIARIVSGELMSREGQIEEFNQYQDNSYDYDKGEYTVTPMPDHLHIFLSAYTYEDYSGYGWLVGYDTEQQMFFTNSGSHCSCYGLEDQWDIEYYSFEQLLEVTQRIVDNDDGDRYGDSDREHAKVQVELLKLLKGE
ncbi:MAG: hypothetical protein [Caudoviricetes sp.]|nr:MAG: hypothetical protein [Caudoviricetes sp.]